MSPLYFPGNRTKIKRRTISNFIGATDNGKKSYFLIELMQLQLL